MTYFTSFLLSLMLLVQLTVQPDVDLQQDSLPLVIVVRDGVGNPLSGVPLEILRTGPPHEPFDSCVTGSDGTCRLLLQPGAYLVQFSGGWRGLSFVPAEQQNGGALDDGGVAGGGFGIYLEPGEEEQVVTFVIGTHAGELVPLWDMSRDLQAAPQPFAVPGNPFAIDEDPLAAVDLGALSGIQPVEVTPTDEGAQVVDSQIIVGAAASATPEAVPSTVAQDEDASISGESLKLGLIAMGIIATLSIAGVILVRRFQKRRKGE